jgi:N-acetylmuramoyl-L-alanine amidase
MFRRHVVQPGECLASLAARFGFADWDYIYEHPENAELRKLRPNPFVLAPGDVVVIPPVRKKVLRLATNQRHVITVRLARVAFRVLVRDAAGEALAKKAFRLEWEDGAVEGVSTEDGHIECEVPVFVKRAQLVVWLAEAGAGARHVWDVALGHLEPVSMPRGARQRLNNLGYFAGLGAGETVDDELRLALRAFQEDQGLSITGELDDATQGRLLAAHGDV